MKATGIVRRIDDLGRVVIPKEIRRTMRLHEGEYIDEHRYRSTDFA
jgi:AbrB family looped-hinge helix DNA binding protein